MKELNRHMQDLHLLQFLIPVLNLAVYLQCAISSYISQSQLLLFLRGTEGALLHGFCHKYVTKSDKFVYLLHACSLDDVSALGLLCFHISLSRAHPTLDLCTCIPLQKSEQHQHPQNHR